MFGSKVISPLIKNKKYRKDLTEFVDTLRASTNFRDRQMYITIAEAAFKDDQEIYKKHFAKAIGNEMCEEKVAVVKVMIVKLCAIVPRGYSKSTDKISDHFKELKVPDVNQFFDETNDDLQQRRFLDPSKFKLKLKDYTEPSSSLIVADAAASKTTTSTSTKTDEKKSSTTEESKSKAPAEKPAEKEDDKTTEQEH